MQNRLPFLGWNCRNGCVDLDGSRMDYVSFGRGNKTLILLPGLSDGLATVKGKAWILAVPYRDFFRSYTVYMFSRKDPMPRGYTIRGMADDMASAMDRLGIRSASVLGVSQGGMIALMLAADHPDKVEKLVLAVTADRCTDTARQRLQHWIRMSEHNDHKGLMIDTAENSYSDRYLKRYRRIYPVIGLIGKPKDYGRFLINAEAILKFDATEDTGSISCPTLIIGGEEDRIVGIEASRELHDSIRGSRILIYPGLGHAAYEEAADFNSRVLHFLKEGDTDVGFDN